MNITSQLKNELWKDYGNGLGEWDGLVYGGGKLSQRFWEYLITIDMLNLQDNDIIVDIGGGSWTTRQSLLGHIIGRFCSTYVLDPTLDISLAKNNEIYITELATSNIVNNLKEKPTHIISVSVLEHMKDLDREILAEVINTMDFVKTIVFTCEYHPDKIHFDTQLTAKTLSNFITKFTNFYVDRFEASPTHCVNAINQWYPIAIKLVSNKTVASAY
jgi:hypothetical protein